MGSTIETIPEWLSRHNLGHLRVAAGERWEPLQLGADTEIGLRVRHAAHGEGWLRRWRWGGELRGAPAAEGVPELAAEGECDVERIIGGRVSLPAAELSQLASGDKPPPACLPPMRVPLCAELFMRWPLVPGRGVGDECPPLWVRLVECLGILIDMPRCRHAAWEEKAGVVDGSRYVPTAVLFALRNATALRRLEQATLVSSEGLMALLDHLTTPTPVRQPEAGGDPGEVALLCPETMRALCGEAAGALAHRVQQVVLLYRGSTNRMDTAHFALALHDEGRSLDRHKEAQAAKCASDLRKGEADMAVVTPQFMFDAAAAGLGDVDFSSTATAVPPDFDLGHMFGRGWEIIEDEDIDDADRGLPPQQLVTISVVQLCAAASLLLDPPPPPDYAEPLVAPRRPHRSLLPPSSVDEIYWARVASIPEEDEWGLLRALPPFHRRVLGPDYPSHGDEQPAAAPTGGPTWRELLSMVSKSDGSVSEALRSFRPSHHSLRLRAEVLRRADRAWRAVIERAAPDRDRPGQAVWYGRCVRAMLRAAGRLELIKPLCWFGSCIDLADPLRAQAEALAASVQAAARVAVHAATAARAAEARRDSQAVQEATARLQRRKALGAARVTRLVAEQRITGGDALLMQPPPPPDPGEEERPPMRIDGEEGEQVECTFLLSPEYSMRVGWPRKMRKALRFVPTADLAMRAALQGIDLADDGDRKPPTLALDVPCCKQDVSETVVTDAQVLWLFQSLDTNHNGWLEKEEVERFYSRFVDPCGVPCKPQELDILLGMKGVRDESGRPETRVGLEAFRRMLLAVAKR